MKLFKYFAIALAVSSAALVSCSDREALDTYPLDSQDGKALVQVMYMEPVTTATANRIYRIEINGRIIENNESEILARYNAFPGGAVGLFESVDPGNVNIKLYRGHFEDLPDPETGGKTNKSTLVVDLYYEGNVTLNAGDKGSAIIYAPDKAPVFIPLGEVAMGPASGNTADWAAVRMYNFMFDSEGVPTTKKVQLRMIDVDGDKLPHNLGKPIAFGEATDWEITYVHKTTYNSGGSQRRDLDCVFVDDEGNVEPITWVNSSGKDQASFTDWWTMSIGRGYAWYLRGVRDNKNYPIAITQWTCR